MPLFLDRHDLPGATAEDLANAHLQDLAAQDSYGVRYLTYWFDPGTASAFCLAEGPSATAVDAVHKETHGIQASRILEVDPGTIQRFFGRISEHPAGEPYVETAMRIILFTDIEGSTDMTRRLGDAAAMEVLRTHDTIVRGSLSVTGGSEVKHTGDGIMASFGSVAGGLECSARIQRQLNQRGPTDSVPLRVRIGLSAGEPVTENGDLFGAAVQLAARVCNHAQPDEILVTAAVRDLALGKGFHFHHRGTAQLKGFDEPVAIFAVHWQA